MRRKKRSHEKRQPVTKKITGLELFLPALVFAVVFTGCSTAKLSSFDPMGKLPPEKMQEDFVLLKKILESNHPGLYWYTPKDSLDFYFDEALQGMDDSLTAISYKNQVAWFVSKINCGHTSAGVSTPYIDYAKQHLSLRFPLFLKCWDDSLVVLGSMYKNDPVFRRGTVITAIDNRCNREIIDSMFRFISTDGYANNFKNQAISFNFPLYYGYAYPLKDSFLVGYIDSAGINQTAYLKPFKPIKDTTLKAQLNLEPEPSKKEKKQYQQWTRRSLDFDTTNHLAYMRIATFSNGNLQKFFRQSFREIEKRNVTNLVIDLRENTGGKINISTKFARYLKDTAFHVADTVAAISRSLKYSKYIKPALPYKVVMRFASHKEPDGMYHFRNLENQYHEPYSRHHFNGNIYIIQGGYTFSAASMLVMQLKGQYNVTVVGEETGGGNYGMSAVHIPAIILPNTKVKVSLPLYRVVTNSAEQKNGRGVMPDIYVPPSSIAIRNGIDPKLQKVKELIRQKEQANRVQAF